MTNDLNKGGLKASVCAFSLSNSQILPQKAVTMNIGHDIDDDYIRALNPSVPVPVLRPERLVKQTKAFIKAFTGHIMYAVKCNPDKVFLKAIHKGGVRRFDAASIAEIRTIRGLFPAAKIYFMHPIKAPEAIREAYVNHGVRAFVLDYADELDKILHETNAAPDLELFVRLAIPKDKSGDVATDFSSKFGAKAELAAELLRLCRPHCTKLGLSFHVGTQCYDPLVYSKAVKHARNVIDDSAVTVETLDIGGGFPAELIDAVHDVPPVTAFTQAIADAVTEHGFDDLELLCEIGRGLVACAGSLIVRVEGRKDDLLYLNDGTYGGFFEAGGSVGLRYPVSLIRREERDFHGPLKAFRFAGPTCDSIDMMNGPFMLPSDIKIGDWIKLDQIGAYGEVSRTDFNGFGTVHKIIVQKEVQRDQKLDVVNI